MNELDAKFQVAVDFIAARGNNKLTNEQVGGGRTSVSAAWRSPLRWTWSALPSGAWVSAGRLSGGMVGLSARVCRESWKALGDLDPDMAKRQYVEWVQDLFEEFDVRGPKRWRSSSTSSSSKASSETLSLDNSISMAGVVSMPKVDMSTEEWKVKDDVFHYASTGDLNKLVAALDQGEEGINAQVSD
ncbi:unnamed protein product [Phytophthora fragariaefolia]|uniref:Unnamed protein product n=1 Tax=Phytophthora fragariaefolia TaxID=1490495 RepID=A0A9W6U403_9STRA|nr:unnamed protein product [Phytophthora fragariaefolia]